MKKNEECVLQFCYEIRIGISKQEKLEYISMRSGSKKYFYFNRRQILETIQNEEERENLKKIIKAIAFMYPKEKKQLYGIIEKHDQILYEIFNQMWEEIIKEL